MKCLIVTAHPLKDSLCHQLAEHVTGTLRQLGHEVTMEDLYAEKFDPALTPEERASYYQDRYDATKVAQQVDRLKASEILVLVFPTWWFGFPAILKGWFDRVWGPGVAYDHAKDFGPIRPRLNHLKRVLVGHLHGFSLVGGSADHAAAGQTHPENRLDRCLCRKKQA